jgi:transcriptional regulator with XRE-family HTH domain
MSYKRWKSKILAKSGAKERVATIKAELLQAAGLTDLREQAGLSQRELADRIGVKQPRVAAIEKADNVRLDVLVRYLEEVGVHLEVVKGKRRMPPNAQHLAPAAACLLRTCEVESPVSRAVREWADRRVGAPRRSTSCALEGGS